MDMVATNLKQSIIILDAMLSKKCVSFLVKHLKNDITIKNILSIKTSVITSSLGDKTAFELIKFQQNFW